MNHTKTDMFDTTPADRDKIRAIARRKVRAKIEHIAKLVAPQQSTVEAIEDAIIVGITPNAKRTKHGDHALNWKQFEQAKPELKVLYKLNQPKPPCGSRG